MGRCEHHRRRRSIVMSPQPVRRSHTPAIAWDESWKPVLRHRGREVVSDAALVVEELRGGYRTHGMASRVVGSGVAPPVPMEAGKRVAAAGLEAASKDIALGHHTSIADSGASLSRSCRFAAGRSGHGPANGLADTDRIAPYLRGL